MTKTLTKWNRSQGSILVLALWVLAFLSTYVILLGAHVRIKMQVLSRLNKTSEVKEAAEAGVRIAKAVYGQGQVIEDVPISSGQKQQWFRNPARFSAQKMGRVFYEVSYDPHLNYPQPAEAAYGFTDEERRININTADHSTLKRLLYYTAVPDESLAEDIATAIIDWRIVGESEITGFFSDDFYDNLEFPYEPKKKDFEALDELMLVKGMTPTIFRKVKDFVTVYGNGKVNINTASRVALYALGLGESLVDRILYVRSGSDGIDGTVDDHIFTHGSGKVSLSLPKSLKLTGEELAVIDYLYVHGFLGIDSSCFRIESRGFFEGSQESRRIMCVFNGKSGKILYWREEKRS